MFLITMPGMVMEKLKSICESVASDMYKFFGGDSTTLIKDEDFFSALNYIEHMGYDLVGYGFLTDYVDDDDGNNLGIWYKKCNR